MNRAFLAANMALLILPGISFAQNLSGTVLTGDTGAPISTAMVRAVGVAASRSSPPIMYQIQTDVNGKYALTVPNGAYRICVSGAGSYLDPCLWGGALTATAGGAASTVRLQKGAMLIARVHGSHDLLSQFEAVHGAAVAAHVSGPSFAQLPLPMVYESATVRDYGAVLPTNLTMTLSVTSSILNLTDSTGVAVSPLGRPLAITDADVAPGSLLVAKFAGMHQVPTVKVVHFYAR